MLYTTSIAKVKTLEFPVNPHIDEAWIIVRSMRTPIQLSVDTIWVPDLSPSRELFTDYLTWKNKGDWNEETFQTQYRPRFLQEMAQNPNSRAILNRLFKASRIKNILALCYCANESLCHRSLIKALIEEAQSGSGSHYQEWLSYRSTAM